MLVALSLLLWVASASDEIFESDAEAMMQVRRQGATFNTSSLEDTVLAKGSPRRRSGGGPCQAQMSGGHRRRTLVCKATCPDAATCIQVVPENQPVPPNWPSESTSPWPPSGSKVAHTLVSGLDGALDPTGISGMLIDIFWPASKSSNSQEDSTFSEYIKWTEKYVNAQIDQVSIENLNETLSGYIIVMQNIQLNPSNTNLTLFTLDQAMMRDSPKFEAKSLGWQSMSLFPNFATFHLSVRNYLLRYQYEPNRLDFQKVTNKTVLQYQATAHQFYKIIIADRLAHVKNVTLDNTECSPVCQSSNWVALDSYRCAPAGPAWDMTTFNAQARMYGKVAVGTAYAGRCLYVDCGSQQAAESCRDSHYSAVNASWSQYWNEQLLEAAEQWPDLGTVPSGGYAPPAR